MSDFPVVMPNAQSFSPDSSSQRVEADGPDKPSPSGRGLGESLPALSSEAALTPRPLPRGEGAFPASRGGSIGALRLLDTLGSLRLFGWLCVYAMLLLTAGTIAQRWIGLLAAQESYFESWLFWLGPAPVPAMRSVLAVMAVNLTARMARMPLSRAKAGLWLAHLGALLLILGGAAAGLGREEGYMLIPEGNTSSAIYEYSEERGDDFKQSFSKPVGTLPFTLALKDVVKEHHPGTEEARDYRSELVIDDGGLKLPVTLELNEPLRYRGYTFYQSSFLTSEQQGEATILAVKKSGAWLYPYLATATLAVGLLWHWRIRRGGA